MAKKIKKQKDKNVSVKTEKPNEEKNVKKQEENTGFDKSKTYSVEKAVKFARETSKVKFDPSVELHARLGIDPKKGEEQVRGTVVLPHGTGKTLRIAVFTSEKNEKDAKASGADIVGGEELINQIKQSGKVDFDVAVATPDIMPKMAPLAKVLGPKGMMPSPKNDTITTKIKEAVEQLKKGKIVFKNDDTANLHVALGKLSFDDNALKENIETFIAVLKKSKPASSKGIFIKGLVLSTSMGPGIKLEI
ncbi:MAG: 50S ribosomal protein L1 [Parcubacteria group bacterium CG10_big_fil_rev_8_21_14_0_10_36_14]|nr:MAG: 50S ribosomal protein L1 [Parcubacteria group bacterium CG10_big_fil_rev_8_21_14_0_10_36_14]